MNAIRWTVLALLIASNQLTAQNSNEERPMFLDATPKTQEQIARQKASQLTRDAQAHFALGILSLRQERMIEASKMLEKALELEPDSVEIRRAFLPVLMAIGREDDALQMGRELLRHHPTDLHIAFQTGRMLRLNGKLSEAAMVLQRASIGKEADSKPETLLLILSDLYELHEREENFKAGLDVQARIIETIKLHQDQLLFGNGFTKIDLQTTLAKAHDRMGKCATKMKEYKIAMHAYRESRDLLLKIEDPDANMLANRMNWNICEMAAAQEKWQEAMDALDKYLQHSPIDIAPYEKKLELLRKLGRERDVIPMMRQYAQREEYHLGVQLLFAKELAKVLHTRQEAERLYLKLSAKQIKVDIYRGLFKLYQAEDRMSKVIDMIDDAIRIAGSKDGEARIEERESAQERSRAMVQVLRTDATLVTALLPVSLEELQRGDKRTINTWVFLGSLAARAKQLDKAELHFRQCLVNVPLESEYQVYAGLLEVLRAQRKYDEIVKLCQEALNGKRPARNTNATLFHQALATAQTELGHYELALKSADTAVKLSSERSKVLAKCHKAEILTRAAKYAEAIAECQETMKEFPQGEFVRMVRYTLANVYTTQSEHAKSEEQLRLILETDPNAPLANNNLGYQLAERNVNLDEAERLIRRAIEMDRLKQKDPEDDADNAAYLDSLGWVLFRRGNFKEAREMLEKAALLPDGADDPTVWDHLGDVCVKLNDMKRAKEAWQNAVKLYQSAYRRQNDAKRTEVEKKLKTLER